MNLFDLAAKITLDTRGFESGIKSSKTAISGMASAVSGAVGAVEKFGEKAIKAGEKIISVGEKAAKTFAAIETGIGTAVGSIVKESIEGFGDFEQFVGGVETLFKESSDTVIESASTAYKRAGVSANEYMETITSFSASLLQGLGGDTVKAAEYADKAIVDMADNAAKMGSDLSSIQIAYQSFSRQQYVLLDNLKLGYGGSASEMARLINESGVLGDAIEVTADTVKTVPFDKIIEAIHVIQTNLGITGTTAKEAAGTIQGSMASARAAFKNFAVGLADGNQDIDLLFDNLIESVGIAADNIAPRIITSIERIGVVVEKRSDDIAGFISGLVTQAAAQAPKFVSVTSSIIKQIIRRIDANKDEMAETGLAFFETLVDSFEETLDLALPIIETLVPTVARGILQGVPVLFKSGVSIIMAVIDGIASDSDGLAESAVGAILTIIDTVDANLDKFLTAGEKIVVSIANAIINNGDKFLGSALSIVGKLVGYITDHLPKLIPAAAKIVASIANAIINNGDKFLDSALSIIEKLVGYITDYLPELIPAAVKIILKLADSLTDPDRLEDMIGAALDLIVALAEGLIDSIPALLEKAPVIISNLITAISENAGDLLEAAISIITELASALSSPENWALLLKGAGEIIAAIISGIISCSVEIVGAGADIIGWIKDGWDSMNPFNWGKTLIENLVGGIESRRSLLKTAIDKINGEGSDRATGGGSFGGSSTNESESGSTHGGGGGSFGGGSGRATGGGSFDFIGPVLSGAYIEPVGEEQAILNKSESNETIGPEININVDGAGFESDTELAEEIARVLEDLFRRKDG